MGASLACWSTNGTGEVFINATNETSERNEHLQGLLVGEMVLNICAIIINVLALTALALTPNKNPSILFLTSLAVAELLCPLSFMAEVCVGEWWTKTHSVEERVIYTFLFLLVTSAIDSSSFAVYTSLICITADRLIASCTVNYSRIVTAKRARGAIASSWICAAIVGTFPVLYILVANEKICETIIHEEYIKKFHVSILVIVFAGLSGCYIFIFYNLRSKRLALSSAGNVDKQIIRGAITAFMIVIAFIILRFPRVFLHIHLDLASPEEFVSHQRTYTRLDVAFKWMSRLNFIVDPLIYVGRNRLLRQPLLKRLSCLSKQTARDELNGSATEMQHLATQTKNTIL